jgi:hypothetical protein
MAIIGQTDARSVSMEVMKREEGDPENHGMLPVVQIGPRHYAVDLRLRQFRSVKNPHECVDFDNEKGRRMCEQAGIVLCRECQMAALVSPAADEKELRCMNCLALIVPRVRL